MTDSINVATGFDEKLLMELFTTDISVEECIFDLIDNSIDAARKEIQAGSYEKDDYGLPLSYKGHKIELDVSTSLITILDNCHGISRSEFENSTFIIGERSAIDYSIGFYGIGLKRALLKLGNKYDIVSDDGSDNISFQADRKTLSQSKTTAIASVNSSSGTHSFKIEISDLDKEIKDIISDKQWMYALREKIVRRYGIILQKGLALKFDGKLLKGFVPKLRKKGPVPAFEDNLDSVAGVDIHIQTGMHSKYRMRHENGFSQAANNKLTDDFGWYVVCNDRIMIVGDKSKDIGLTSNWHTEYNGFIGWVFFVAKDASDLPWNTKKTQIVMEAPSFMKVKGLLQDYTDEWKKKNKLARPKKPKAAKAAKAPSISPGSGTNIGKAGGKNFTPKPPLTSPLKLENLEPDVDIYADLQALNIGKLTSLYYSIVSIELAHHTPLIAVGVWSFLESLSALAGRTDNTSFSSFWSQQWSKNNSIPSSASNKAYKGIFKALERLQDAGNITKHDAKAAAYNCEQLNNDLVVLKAIIIKSIEIAETTK